MQKRLEFSPEVTERGELGKAIPYGAYDIDVNQAWVSVGINRDTPECAFTPFGFGGASTGVSRTTSLSGFRSLPTTADAMEIATGFGNTSCSDWLMKRAW